MKRFILLSLSLLFAGSMFSQQIKKLTTAEAQQFLQKNKSIQLVDIRTPQEYAYIGHIKKALNINYLDPYFGEIISKKLKSKKPVFIYCQSGLLSDDAANFLLHNGFQQIYILEKGIYDWKNEKYPVVFGNK